MVQEKPQKPTWLIILLLTTYILGALLLLLGVFNLGSYQSSLEGTIVIFVLGLVVILVGQIVKYFYKKKNTNVNTSNYHE